MEMILPKTEWDFSHINHSGWEPIDWTACYLCEYRRETLKLVDAPGMLRSKNPINNSKPFQSLSQKEQRQFKEKAKDYLRLRGEPGVMQWDLNYIIGRYKDFATDSLPNYGEQASKIASQILGASGQAGSQAVTTADGVKADTTLSSLEQVTF